jgi:hypothetical protein
MTRRFHIWDFGLWIADLGRHRAQGMRHFTKARREVGRDEDLKAEVGTGNVEFLPVLRTNGLSFLQFTVYRLPFTTCTVSTT